MLIDSHNRIIDYVRIAITDKCNLRCFYCMPEKGISFVKKQSLLSYEEMLRLVALLADNGIHKVRITGGEPFLRKDFIYFLRELSKIKGLKKIAITTNGTLTEAYLDELISLGITSFNLSIDSIDPTRFKEITRRDAFDKVWSCYKAMLNKNLDLKLNAVVMDGRNIDDLIPMVGLGKDQNVSIRFIEEMPFNGSDNYTPELKWNYIKILDHISSHYPEIEKLQDPKNSTSLNYRVNGFKGSFGIIPAYTRSFCGSCNRIRITPTGLLKTCLYDDGVFNIRDLMRADANDNQLLEAIQNAIQHKAKDGFEAEKNRKLMGPVGESMATIGG
ncbi:MAG: GTP 3',8-cyclase MoaA [Saprospiraceae bacterium]|nr:GTP 3',8-cyclase MoaA [Saprospiraceae bacterium]